MSATFTQDTPEWGSGGASSSLLSHPSRPSHRLAADFNAAASPAAATSPSLSDIRARLQDVMRTIDTTLDETANPTPLLPQHAPVVGVHRREYRAGQVSGAAAVSAPPPASSSASSACRSSSVASSASWSSRHRIGGESGLQSARPSAATRDGNLIQPSTSHDAPSRSTQQDGGGRFSGGHCVMQDKTGHRPPLFGQRGEGHGSTSDEDSAATRGATTASTGLSATYQARLDFWHPAAHHTLPHQNVARGEKTEEVAGGAAPAHSVVSALSSHTTASQYMRPISRGQRGVGIGVGAGAAAATTQGLSRPSNTVTDTLTSTIVTTDRSSCSSSTASTSAEARRAAHATPQVAGHVPPRTASVPSALPSLPHPSTVPSLSARLAVLRAADAAQRSALQRPYYAAESTHADPLGMLSRAAEAAAVPAGSSSAASAPPPPLLHHDFLAAASCSRAQDAPVLSPNFLHGAAPSCTRSPTRRPPAAPTPAASPSPLRSHAVVYGINDSHHSDNLVRSPNTRHSSGAGAGAASPSSAERRTRRTTRQAETQRIVELALTRQAAAEEAWRESEAHASTTPMLLLQQNSQQRRPPPQPRSASPALRCPSHTALITTAPLDALQAHLTRDVEGRSSNVSAGALAREGELPMQEELAVRAMLAARRNGEAAFLGNGSGGVGEVEGERRRMEGRGLGSGGHTPQGSRFARFSQPDSNDTLQRRRQVNEALADAAAAAAVAAAGPHASLPSSPAKAPEAPELRAVRAHAEQLAKLRERMQRAEALPSQQLITKPDSGRKGPVASASASNAVGGLSSSSASSTLNIPDVAASAHLSRSTDAPHRSPPTPQYRTPTAHLAKLTAGAAVTVRGVQVEGEVQSSSQSSNSGGGGDGKGDGDALLSSVSATSVDERAGTPERAVVVVPAGAKSSSAVRGGGRRVEPPSPRQGRTTRGGDAPRDEIKEGRDNNGNSGRLDATQRPSSRPPPPPRAAPQLKTTVEVASASRAKAAGTPPRAHHRVSLSPQSAEPPSPLPVKPPISSLSSSSLLPRQPRHDAAPNTRDAVGLLQVRASLPVEDAERDIVSSASPSATRPMTTPPRKEAEEGESCCASLTPERVAGLQSVRLHVSPARGTAWQDPYLHQHHRQHHRHGSSSSSTSTSSNASAASPPLSATPPLPLRSTTAAASAPSPPPPSSSLSPTRGPSPPSQRSPPLYASRHTLPEERPKAVDPLLLHQRAVRRDSNRHAVLRAQSMLMEHGVAVEVQLSGRRLPAVVKLSGDATELLFYLERAAPAEAAAGSTPTRARPRVALSPPPSGASSAVSAVAPARSASAGAAPPRFAQPSWTTAAPNNAAPLPPHAGVRPPPPHVVLQQHAAHQRGSLYSVSPSVRASSSAPAPATAASVAAPPRPMRLVKVPAGSVMLPGRISTVEGRAPPAGNVSPRFHTRPPPQSPPSAAAAALQPRPSPLSPSASAARARTQRRPSPAAPHGTHVRELHHFPCTFARVYVPFGVVGYEADRGMGGPHTWEEVGGMLCGPASYEVLRRYGCPLFAHMRGAAYAPYRVYVIIPEFRRIDVPQDAVLLVLDFKQRVDWVLFLLAMQRNAGGRRATDAAAAPAAGAGSGDELSWEGGAAAAALHERTGAPLLSYGRALWLLAVQRLQRARALRGLNPFESVVSNRSGSARRRSGAAAAAVSPSPQRRGLLRGGEDGAGFEAEEREREGLESHPVAVWDAQVIRGARQQRAPPRAVPAAAAAATAAAAAASPRFTAPKTATSPPLRSPRRGRVGGESGAVAAVSHASPSQPSALIRSPRPTPSPSAQLNQRHGSSGASLDGVPVSRRMRQPERRAAASAEGTTAAAGRQPPNSGAASSVEDSSGQQQQQRPMYAEETSKPRFHWLRRVASSLQSSRRGSVSSRRHTASEKG